MYALFTSVPLVGHVNPLLRQAEELRRRGWRVALASTSDMRPHIEADAPDVPFVDLGSLDDAGQLRRQQDDASITANFALGSLAMVRGLIATWPVFYDGLMRTIAVDRPAVIVSDFFTAAGVCAADRAGVPVVMNNADLLASISARVLPPADHLPLLFSGRSRAQIGAMERAAAPLLRAIGNVTATVTVGRDLNRQRGSRQLLPVDIHARQRTKTILVNGVFGLEYERPLPENVHMVGPMGASREARLSAEDEAWLSSGAPVVYCNLGTLASAPDEQLRKMAAAFGRGPWRVWWVLRPEHRWPAVAANVRFTTWGPPPIAVTAHPNVRVFVSHCGINSVYESLAGGTPIVGLPMFADQRDMAIRVADAGAGLWLHKHDFTGDELASAIDRVAAGDGFRAALPALQKAIANSGGVTRAADLIVAASAVP